MKRPTSTTSRQLRHGATAIALAIFALPLAAQVDTAAATARFDIPAQPLPSALALFARQAGAQLVFAAGLADGLRGNAVSGQRHVDEALADLVRGTGLRARRSGATLTLERAPSGASVTTLTEVTVSADSAEASATSPVNGYIARRSATALKTDTPLRETPQSVTVVGAEEMAARKTDSLADALGYANSIVSQPASFSRVADDYSIRGFDAGGRTGSVMRDGMKLQATQFDGGQEPYGLERVELLRGPSSVLYGQMSPGGLVNTVSKRPTTEPLHEILLEAGSHDCRQIATDHAGALNADGSLSYRITALVRESGTQLAQVDDDKRYIAPALTWRPDADTSFTLLASEQRIDTKFVAPMAYDSTLYSRTAGLKIPYTLFTGEPGFDRYAGKMTTVGYLFEKSFAGGPKLRHALRRYAADVRYSYITPTTVTRGNLARRYDARDDESTAVTSDTSLEWQLGSGRWQHTLLAGFDVYRKDYDGQRFSGSAPSLNLADPVYGRLPVVGRTNSGSRQVSTQSGVYLQDQIRFDDRWVMVLGGRYDSSDSRNDAYATSVRTQQDDRKFSGRIGLVRLFDNGLAPYASFSQSFFPASGTDRFGAPFKPVLGEQYEAGVRYQPAGSRTSLSAAIYQLEQKNVLTEDLVDSSFDVQTGKVRSRGLELEARFSPVRALSVTASYNYTDARTVADNDPALVGQRTVGVPRHSASVWADYHLAALGLERARIAAGLRYVGPLVTASSASIRQTDGYTVMDLLLSYQIDAHWQASLKVQNLTDKRYVHCLATCRYGDERNAVVTVAYRW